MAILPFMAILVCYSHFAQLWPFWPIMTMLAGYDHFDLMWSVWPKWTYFEKIQSRPNFWHFSAASYVGQK